MAFHKKSRTRPIAEAKEGINIYPPNKIVQNVSDTKTLTHNPNT